MRVVAQLKVENMVFAHDSIELLKNYIQNNGNAYNIT